jgi:uncharacterized membrane protein
MIHIKVSHSPFFTPGGPIRFGRTIGGPFGPGPFGSNGPLAALLAVVLFVVVVALIALLVTLIIRRNRFAHRFAGAPRLMSHTSYAPAVDALRILDERFARGEIDSDDYQQRRDLLKGQSTDQP